MGTGLTGILGGLGQMFKGAKKPTRDASVRDGIDVNYRRVFSGYPWERTKVERIKWLLDQRYWMIQYEKLQLHRKWFRNHLFFTGYHDALLSDVGMSFDAIGLNSAEYSFASNYYRSYIRYGVAMEVQTAPEFIAQPTSEDPTAQGIAEAARIALDISKENIGFDALRAMEAQNKRLYGNSFRYTYYNIDENYGLATVPVYEDVEVQLDQGSWSCQSCGSQGLGNVAVCPNCGPSAPVPVDNQPPQLATIPQQKGVTSFPRGQESTEVVWPFEVYVRSSVKNLRLAPELLRVRMVDKAALQSTFPKANFGGDQMPGEITNTTEDIGLIYQMAVPDLPSDPTQYPGWYERALAEARLPLIEGWFRPNQYFFDPDLKKEFPKGMYAAKANDCLLTSRNESMDDHWTHFKHIHVEGRFWGDGDDDLIPEQMTYDATDRMLLRHVDYNTMPLMLADTQRIDKNNFLNDSGYMIEAKNLGQRNLDQVVKWFPGGQISNDVWNWRQTRLQNMQFHSGVSPAAIGQHEEGINTFGGQQTAVAQAQGTLAPIQLMYKEENELWARQILKIDAENWLDDRVATSMGPNGQWEFKKLRGELLDPNRFKITARIIPLDPIKQQSLNQAIAVGAFNPQLPPQVRRKVMENYQIPPELDQFSEDTKVQQKEIDGAKANGGQFPPPMIHQDDDAHMATLAHHMNSDEFDGMDPQYKMGANGHFIAHLQNKANKMAIMGAMQGMHTEAGGQGQQGQQQGGQDPNQNPQFQHERGQKGAAAKPHQPQPSGGNGAHVGPRGQSRSAQQRRRNGRHG